MICGRGMSSDAGGRPEVKGMTGHPPAVCSRVWPRRRDWRLQSVTRYGKCFAAADSAVTLISDKWDTYGSFIEK